MTQQVAQLAITGMRNSRNRIDLPSDDFNPSLPIIYDPITQFIMTALFFTNHKISDKSKKNKNHLEKFVVLTEGCCWAGFL